MSITWSDELGNRSRKPWLLLVHGDRVTIFAGKSIPDVVVVRGSEFRKNGKWSHTTYRLELADGVRAIPGLDGWETGRFAEGLQKATKSAAIDTWGEFAEALGVSIQSATEFLRGWRPKAAERLDTAAAELAALNR